MAEPTSVLLVYLGIYLSVFALFLLLLGASGKYAGDRHKTKVFSEGSKIDQAIHGFFASAWWPIWLRGPVSLLISLLGIMPCAIIAVCFTFGPLLAWLEDWAAKDGILYIISNMLGLITPLTDDISPETTFGLVAGVIVSTWCMLMGNAAMGVVAGLSLIDHMADNIPHTFLAFIRCIFIYIPLLIVFSCSVLGAIMAAMEDWSWSDGFFFVVAGVCQLANPLVENVPETGAGMAVEVLSVSVELGFAGATIGIIGVHPFMRSVIAKIEGKDVDKQFGDLVTQLSRIDDSHHVSDHCYHEALRITKSLRSHGLLPALPTTEELQCLFLKLDKDGDGMLDRKEVVAALAEIGVSRPDTDGSGVNIFGDLDVDEDGKVSKDEFMKQMERLKTSDFDDAAQTPSSKKDSVVGKTLSETSKNTINSLVGKTKETVNSMANLLPGGLVASPPTTAAPVVEVADSSRGGG